MRYSEALGDGGDIDQSRIGGFVRSGDCQTDRYICRGDAQETWEPRFTYHGFRYVQVEGLPSPPALDHIRGRVVHTAFESIGSFECSSADLNALQACTRRSHVSNFVGIPTDCPHREKNGWTGDAQLAAETGLLNYDAAASYRQWLQTMADTQRPSGQFPGIVPSSGWGYNWGSGPAWDSAFILIPWYIYLYTGDASAITIHYDAMRRYMDFCATMASDDTLAFGLGDWCPVNTDTMPEAGLTSTAYYFVMATHMATFAHLTGNDDDAEAYGALANRIRRAFNDRYYRGDGIYAEGQMTALGCALYQGLVEESQRAPVVQRLADAVIANHGRVDFGILGAKYVPRALAANGHIDLAFQLITQPEFPGWVHWLRQGATTLWEDWKGEYSRNHVMFGDISAWMFHYLAGIQPDPEHPGFRQVVIAPHPVGQLDWVRASHRSPQGPITSAWQRDGDVIRGTIALPHGVNGMLKLPDGSTRGLDAGEHGYTIACRA